MKFNRERGRAGDDARRVAGGVRCGRGHPGLFRNEPAVLAGFIRMESI